MEKLPEHVNSPGGRLSWLGKGGTSTPPASASCPQMTGLMGWFGAGGSPQLRHPGILSMPLKCISIASPPCCAVQLRPRVSPQPSHRLS